MSRTFVALLAAAVTMVLSFSPRLDALADAFFAWHMVQHLALLFVVPFFVLVARPFTVLSAVATKGATRLTVRIARRLESFAHPVVALTIFIATLWITHFSSLYEFALQHAWAHVGEHVLYLCAGALFWMPVIAPPPLRPFAYPVRLLYLLVALPQGALLAFALAASRHPLYAHYARNPAALADQSNAAAIMWIGGGLVVFVAFLCTFGAWALREREELRPQPGGTIL